MDTKEIEQLEQVIQQAKDGGIPQAEAIAKLKQARKALQAEVEAKSILLGRINAQLLSIADVSPENWQERAKRAQAVTQ